MAMAQTKIFPWFFDLDNGRMVIDARWFDHVGIPRGDCSMSPGIFFDMLHPDDRETLSAAFAKQLSGILTPEAYAYRVRRCDGTWEWFEGQSVYLGQAHDGSPYRVVGICQSIQAHKEVEGRLREARDKARENDRLKSAFLANMSHEIRTPLNAIIGFANLVTCDDVPFSETERQEYSRLISANGDQLLRLISDILDLSKIESNTMEFCFGDQSLHTLLSDIYQSQLLTMPPQVELRLELPQADTTIRTDASRLKQVINNLINNAAKFTDRGSITFGYRTDEGAGEVELFVRDTGKGISQEHVGRIFERFYKTDSNAKGVGLGLSICRSIAERLGGRIEVRSQVGEGSTFTLCLPCCSATAVCTDAEGSADRRRKVILVAEDVETNFKLLEAALSKEYVLRWVPNGQEAVLSFVRERPDLILMDIRMPVMNGIEATEKIRAISPDVPIVAVTAHVFYSEKEQALAAGCNTVVSKPYSPDDLRKTVRRLLGTDA